MSRKSYDSWKIEITQFNKNYVACDCGSLAKKGFNKHYFDCPYCHRKYVQNNGTYIECKK